MLEINIKANFPTVAQSRQILYSFLKNNNRASVVKVIHGYGSTGQGGAIKRGIRKTFANMIKSGKIKDYIDGENFHIFNDKTVKLINRYPDIKNDKDLLYLNEGITILILK